MTNGILDEIEIDTNKSGTIDPGSDQLMTIKQFCEEYPWPSESAMRAYVYRAEELGISDAIIRFKRRVLIRPCKFFHLITQLENRSSQGGKYETTSCQKGKVHV